MRIQPNSLNKNASKPQNWLKLKSVQIWSKVCILEFISFSFGMGTYPIGRGQFPRKCASSLCLELSAKSRFYQPWDFAISQAVDVATLDY